MFTIDTDKTISITRGDSGSFVAPIDYALQPGDVLRLKVFRKKACEDVVLQKDFVIGEATKTVTLELTEKDTRIGGVISKPVDYWYEIELNPDNNPKTLVGYDEDGAKIFKLYPEGRDLEDDELTEEEVDTFRKLFGDFKNEIYDYVDEACGDGGADGKDGVSITSVEQTTTSAEDGGNNVITVTLSDDTTSTFTVKNGSKGSQGVQGIQGEKGDKGDTGSQGAKGDKGDKGDTGASGSNGKDGTSVTVSKVTESTADGGSNVVTFSDGKTLTIKNGSKGSKGVDGKDYIITPADKQEIKNEILSSIITQEAGESESLVMSQKAVTDLVNKALAESETTEYEIVDSVDQMLDVTKQYVLRTTGTLWSYTPKQVVVENNEYNPNTVKFNKRLNSSNTEKDLGGSLLTDYIAVEYAENYPVTIKGIEKLVLNYSSYFLADFYTADKTHIGQLTADHLGFSTTASDGTLPITFNLFHRVTDEEKYKNAKYVRIKLGIATDGTNISASNCEGLVINFEPKNSYQEVSDWCDTGITPEQANTNYVDLLVKVNQNTSDISEISMRMTNLENGSEALTIPSFWQDAVNECIAKIKGLQVGKNCVTFPFFSDNHTRNGYVGILISHIMKECHIPYCFYGGDTIASGYLVESEMIAQDKAFDTIMSYIPNGRFCRALGNHDGFWKVSASEKHSYTREQVYELFLREEGIAQNKHFGEDGTYYYIDDIASKVRWVVLNTNPVNNHGAGNEVIDSEQLSWLQNTALSFNENGWGVVIISHCPISNHYHANVTNADEVISVVNGSNVDVIGWYSGHIHRDRMYTHSAVGSTDGVEGTDGDELGFTQVTITSDHTGIAYDDATKHTVANDDQSHAIDFITINKSTRTVNITRLGIGEDRSYSY